MVHHRFAFAGFGHAHIEMLYKQVRQSSEIELAGACEPDHRLRSAAESNGIRFTHDSYEQMLDTVDCDVVAVGAYFADDGGPHRGGGPLEPALPAAAERGCGRTSSSLAEPLPVSVRVSRGSVFLIQRLL